MLRAFKKFKPILNQITHDSDVIVGLQQNKKNKLEALRFSEEEWLFLDSLMLVLEPLYFSTCLLSGRSYPTLSTAKAIENILISRFSQLSRPLTTGIIMAMSKLILEKIELYFKSPTKISASQLKLMLVINF